MRFYLEKKKIEISQGGGKKIVRVNLKRSTGEISKMALRKIKGKESK